MAEAEPQTADPAADQAGTGDTKDEGAKPNGEAQPELKLDEGAVAPTETPSAVSTDDWRGSIENEDVKKFADRFASPAALAQTAFDQRQKLSNAISVPGDDASDEDIAAFRKATGVPDAAADYDIAISKDIPEPLREGDVVDERLGRFREAMHKAGAPGAAVQQAVDWYFGELVTDLETVQTNGAEALEKENDALHKEWRGGDYDRNVELAKRGATRWFGDEANAVWFEAAKVDGIALGDHPRFLRIFAEIERNFAEGRPGGIMNEVEIGDARSEHARLTTELHKAKQRGDDAEARRLDAQRSTISAQLAGKEPIVGEAGRTA